MGPKIRGSTRRKREEDDDYVKTGGKRRTRGKKKYIGAHVRIAGEIQNPDMTICMAVKLILFD